jgi:transcriptional regulator GlxA family with amidase domain
MSAPQRTHHVAILAFDEVEALDLAGPYEVFTTASRMAQRDHPSAPPSFVVSCVARDCQPVRARAGMTLLPSHGFADLSPVDVLIVPGGVVDAAMQDAETLAWIVRTAAAAEITASVCTGAFLLAASGVLKSGPVTTHWEDQADFAAQFPALEVRSGVRWVEQEQVGLITSGGISAGIDMSLHLVARLTTEALAQRTATQMEFQWTRET